MWGSTRKQQGEYRGRGKEGEVFAVVPQERLRKESRQVWDGPVWTIPVCPGAQGLSEGLGISRKWLAQGGCVAGRRTSRTRKTRKGSSDSAASGILTLSSPPSLLQLGLTFTDAEEQESQGPRGSHSSSLRVTASRPGCAMCLCDSNLTFLLSSACIFNPFIHCYIVVRLTVIEWGSLLNPTEKLNYWEECWVFASIPQSPLYNNCNSMCLWNT